jgi:mono/diheme cytochrome c family protein
MHLGLLTFSALSLLPLAALAQGVGDPRAGLAFADQVCAGCHAVRQGDRRSPQPNAPSFEQIADVPGMTATALYVALQSSHKTMPNLMFEPAELRNVVAYILTLKRGE